MYLPIAYQLLARKSIDVHPILQLGQHRGDALHQGVSMNAAAPSVQTGITLFTGFLFHATRMQLPSMSDPVFLSDVIMADILTSCARILADLCLVMCQFSTLLELGRLADAVRSKETGTMCVDPGTLGALVVAMPYAFRLRQCVNEYMKAPRHSSEAKRHLANAVKYASSFPVICLSATQKKVVVRGLLGAKSSDWSIGFVFGLWILSVAFNSLYSFYWDIAFDWDLGYSRTTGWRIADLIAPQAAVRTHHAANDGGDAEQEEKGVATSHLSPADALKEEASRSNSFEWILRPRLCFAPPMLYYFAMATDFLLRVAWAMKLSPHIQIDTMPYGGLWLNVLEIYRRWQWTFLRIEKEAAAMPPF
ncbi:EXS-domain-containing protein [Linderina pennispora]|uniref:EXS-domain-containing protein n=1 Tax=Linderina pennispora TaxID=61395 RepID=A0A1Y1VZ65_9FUNG|nr:EXS-domain-containing protein [Linderina pennispora]ORX66306.1 EXS-domain-containing protein [Linderina pennispora]